MDFRFEYQVKFNNEGYYEEFDVLHLLLRTLQASQAFFAKSLLCPPSGFRWCSNRTFATPSKSKSCSGASQGSSCFLAWIKYRNPFPRCQSFPNFYFSFFSLTWKFSWQNSSKLLIIMDQMATIQSPASLWLDYARPSSFFSCSMSLFSLSKSLAILSSSLATSSGFLVLISGR